VLPELAHHNPALAHQFENLAQQKEASTLGMWVFLVTEILFFGGLFATYCVYRNLYAAAFTAASRELIVWAGTINTAVLIASSLTMALAVRAAQTEHSIPHACVPCMSLASTAPLARQPCPLRGATQSQTPSPSGPASPKQVARHLARRQAH